MYMYIYYIFVWADQRLVQGNIRYIALLPGQYLDIVRERGRYPDIAPEGGFQLSFDPPFDPTFHL